MTISITPEYTKINTPQAHGRGFQITFENGLAISVQFGSGNYCERGKIDNVNGQFTSSCAEIAVFMKSDHGNRFTKEIATTIDPTVQLYDDVVGHVKPNDIAQWIYATSIYKVK